MLAPTVRRIRPQFAPAFRPAFRPAFHPAVRPAFHPAVRPSIPLTVRPQFPRVRPAIRPVRRVRFPMAIDTTTTTSERGKWWRRKTDRMLERGAWDGETDLTQGQLALGSARGQVGRQGRGTAA